jgi:hypothetical protein
MMSMTAITIRAWIQLPVFGNLGLMFEPKKPSSYKISPFLSDFSVGVI